MSKKTIVFTFGRYQPPTTGHGKLFNAVISHAKSVGGEHRIYASQSFDGGRPRAAVKNPLQYKDKIRFLKQMFPQANIVKSGAGIDTFMDVLYDLEKRGYKKIHMIVGEDRVEGIQNTVDKYLNTGGEKALNLEEFKVVSAGHRDPEATGVEGMSASKLRAAVAANDFKLFKTGMPTGFSGARELFDAIAKGLAKPMKKSKKTINEKAPPDEKAERMISKAKESFQDRYGDNADSYLYGVAWKQYNKRHGIKTKTRLGEPIMEGGVKSVIEDFIYDLPKEAIEELKVIMKEKYGSSRTNKLIKIRGKYKLPTQVMGYPTVQLINDYFNTYFGDVNEEIELDEAGQAKLYRMRQSHGRAWRRGDTEKQTAMGNATYDKQTKEDEKDVKRTGSVFNMRVKRMAGNRKLLGISDSFEVQHQDGVELDEVTIPDHAEISDRNLVKKTITFKWHDGKKWVYEEVPQDEAPGFYARAGTAMKTRKTDKFGNLIKAPVKPKVNMDDVMAANMKTAKELIDLINGKPVGAVVTFYGKKPNKADEYEMNIVRMMYQGDMIYTVKSSGRFVELRPTASGLQIVDTKTHRILLDKGNDAIW